MPGGAERPVNLAGRRRARRPAGRGRPPCGTTAAAPASGPGIEQLAAEPEPSTSAEPQIRCAGRGEQQVEVLDGLSGGALHQVVEGRDEG